MVQPTAVHCSGVVHLHSVPVQVLQIALELVQKPTAVWMPMVQLVFGQNLSYQRSRAVKYPMSSRPLDWLLSGECLMVEGLEHRNV